MNVSRRQRALAWCWLGLRCARLVVVLPVQLRRTSTGSQRLVAAYRRTVAPVIQQRATSPARGDEIDARLLGWAVQGGYLIQSYARVIGQTDAEEIAAVAASFMRLYDDLLERPERAVVGKRLDDLFAGSEVTAEGDIEAIVADLFRWLDGKVSPENDDLLHARLSALHHAQLEVVDEANRRDETEILELTLAKGGAAMLILGGLVNPRLGEADVAVLERLGGVLQLIDDYDDTFEDRDILTSANALHIPYGVLAAELRAVSRGLLDLYGARPARPFIDGLYSWLVLVGIRRVLDRFVRRWAPPTSVPRSGLTMVTFRKQHIR